VVESHQAKLEALEREFTEKLYQYLSKALVKGPLTYGFEYEFMPSTKMSLAKVDELKAVLPGLGFKLQADGCFKAFDGLDVSFEPGGQLEYGSPPLFGSDKEGFANLLDHIRVTNQTIEECFGVKYRALDYCSGRGQAPLCIDGRRYQEMHSLFTENGGRGREMMKGTASIHLHVRIRSLNEMIPLFILFQKLAKDPDFAMSASRRAIWGATEPSRYQLPEIEQLENEKILLAHIVRHALGALDLSRRVPFAQLRGPSFDDFLIHLTTIFTDVRLNLKGPTFELRTMDSLPEDKFLKCWRRFVDEVEKTI